MDHFYGHGSIKAMGLLNPRDTWMVLEMEYYAMNFTKDKSIGISNRDTGKGKMSSVYTEIICEVITVDSKLMQRVKDHHYSFTDEQLNTVQ